MPTPPDPTTTANAQSAANNATALFNAKLNRINTKTPFGSQTYNYTPPAPTKNEDGSTTPNTTDPGSFSEDVTYSPDQQKLLDTQTGVTQKAYDLANSQFPRVQNTLDSSFNFSGPSMSGPISANGGPIQKSIAGAGPIQNYYSSGGDIQHSLDYSKVPGLVGGDALAGERKAQSDAIYGEATRNLDPRYAQDETKVGNDLVNRGIPVGSPAFNTAMSNFRQSRDSAYADAQDRATQGGVTAANTLFNQGLSARQQGVGEVNDQGAFVNNAQSLAEQESAARAAFGNSAQSQLYGQNQSDAQFANTAQGQDYAQQLALAQQNAALQNEAHGTAYNEQLQARELPLQEIGGLLGTGNGVQPLNFSGTPIVSTSAPDYAGQVNNQYSGLLNSYNTENANNAAKTGSAVQGVGAIATAAAIAY